MASRRLQGLLRNFLGTFSSRNSDFRGYWLFGLLVGRVEELQVNLLDHGFENKKDPIGFTRFLAIRRFAQQTDSYFEKADLRITRVGEEEVNYGCHFGSTGTQFRIEVVAVARYSGGETYSDHVHVVAAPHSFFKERRREP